tara:strand:- start:326 stop:829 length:504 start_codon:yes stop_codon:yes gene_type:complete
MFGDLFDTIGEWIDPAVDFVAETIGYEDFMEDYTDDFYSAGDQLTDDVLGFIRKGARAYIGTQARKDKVGYKGPTAYRRLNPRSPYRAGASKAGGKSYDPTSSGRIGYGNPNVETALKNLITRTNNQQMGDMFVKYGIVPNIPTGRKTLTLKSANLERLTGKRIKAE